MKAPSVHRTGLRIALALYFAPFAQSELSAAEECWRPCWNQWEECVDYTNYTPEQCAGAYMICQGALCGTNDL